MRADNGAFLTTLALGLCLMGCSAGGDSSGSGESNEGSEAPGSGSNSSGGSSSSGVPVNQTGGASNTGGSSSAGGTGGTGAGTGGEPSVIPPVVTDLYFEGLKYPEESGAEWELLRMRRDLSETYTNGRTTAGGALLFETTSPSVTVNFRFNDGDVQRWSDFGASQNGGDYERTRHSRDATTATVNLTSSAPGELVQYRVALPPWSNPILTSIDLDAGHQLEEFTVPARGAYVALGDSITHGVGQEASFEGYAWQTADDLGLELFNLAIGGDKVNVDVANSLSDWEQLSLVTVLVGYNDWMFNGKTKQEYKDDYAELLEAVRAHHPNVPIVCLSLLTAVDSTSGRTGLPITDFRDAVSEVVSARQGSGDTHVYFAPSDTWTNATSDLSDDVHLNPDGAAKLSDALTDYLETVVGL